MGPGWVKMKEEELEELELEEHETVADEGP
jgi:hypothetical protein